MADERVNPEDWKTYRLLVLETLKRLEDKQESMSRDMNQEHVRLILVETLMTRIAALEAKSIELANNDNDIDSDITAMKTNLAMLGTGITVVVSGAVSLLIKWIFPG